MHINRPLLYTCINYTAKKQNSIVKKDYLLITKNPFNERVFSYFFFGLRGLLGFGPFLILLAANISVFTAKRFLVFLE